MPLKNVYQNSKVIKLGLKHLKCCIKLDQKTLNGLWSLQQWKNQLTDPTNICLGLIHDSELIALGCGWTVLDEINITLIAVNPLHQRIGLGKLILTSLLNYARSRLITVATLEVKETNYAAIYFYESLNFKRIASRPKLYQDSSNAIVFQKTFKKNAKEISS